jgi:hypothetical protein
MRITLLLRYMCRCVSVMREAARGVLAPTAKVQDY